MSGWQGKVRVVSLAGLLISTLIVFVALCFFYWSVLGRAPSPEPTTMAAPEDDGLVSYEELTRGEGDGEMMAMDMPSPAQLATIRAEVRAQIERAVAAKSAGGTERPEIGGARTDTGLPRDALLKRAKTGLYKAKLVYNRPSSMPYGKAKRLTASIASQSLRDAWARVGESYGAARVAQIAVSTHVTAELQGDENRVGIQALGPADKAVTGLSNATWNWYVTPKTMEPFELTLTFYSTVVVDGEAAKIDGPVFTDSFKVEATTWEWAMFQAEQLKPTYMLLAGGLTTMLGVGAWWRNRRKTKGKAKPVNRLGTRKRR